MLTSGVILDQYDDPTAMVLKECFSSAEEMPDMLKVAGAVEVFFTTGEGETAVVAWKQLWAGPAIAAGIILVLFALFFKESRALEEPNVDEIDVAEAAAIEAQP